MKTGVLNSIKSFIHWLKTNFDFFNCSCQVVKSLNVRILLASCCLYHWAHITCLCTRYWYQRVCSTGLSFSWDILMISVKRFHMFPCPVQLCCGWWFKKLRFWHPKNKMSSWLQQHVLIAGLQIPLLTKKEKTGDQFPWWKSCVTRRSTLPLLGLCLFVILMRLCLHWSPLHLIHKLKGIFCVWMRRRGCDKTSVFDATGYNQFFKLLG